MPRDIPIVRTYDHVTKAFPGEAAGSTVVVKAGDVTSGPVAAAIGDLEPSAREPTGSSTGPVTRRRPAPTAPSPRSRCRPSAARATAPRRRRWSGSATRSSRTRSPTLPGVEVNVTGAAAESKDFNEQLAQRLPLVIAFVLGFAFLLLLVTFRSMVVPIKAIVLNLLSVGAAYGVLVLVFQDGLGEGLLGFHSNGGVSSWVPMFLFVILFGLSMDYHVLILSRVREGVDRGMSSDDAVREGISSTAGTVTSAALVMVAVFSIFATLTIIDMKEMGVGLAVAVLIDATIVRAILLPASMTLLGDRNWYLPSSLRLAAEARQPSRRWSPHRRRQIRLTRSTSAAAKGRGARLLTWGHGDRRQRSDLRARGDRALAGGPGGGRLLGRVVRAMPDPDPGARGGRGGAR